MARNYFPPCPSVSSAVKYSADWKKDFDYSAWLDPHPGGFAAECAAVDSRAVERKPFLLIHGTLRVLRFFAVRSSSRLNA
jgi:hypothetical protein